MQSLQSVATRRVLTLIKLHQIDGFSFYRSMSNFFWTHPNCFGQQQKFWTWFKISKFAFCPAQSILDRSKIIWTGRRTRKLCLFQKNVNFCTVLSMKAGLTCVLYPIHISLSRSLRKFISFH